MVPSLLVKISGEEEYKVWKILNKKILARKTWLDRRRKDDIKKLENYERSQKRRITRVVYSKVIV